MNVLDAGTYSVTVTDTHGCQGFAETEVDIIVGTVEPAEEWGLKVAPNSSSGMVRIWMDQLLSGKLKIALFDSNGRRLRDLSMDTPTLTLDLTDVALGFYTFRVSDGKKVGSMRLVVMR